MTKGSAGGQRGEGPGSERTPGSWELLSRTAAGGGGYVMFRGLLPDVKGQL